MSFSTYFHTIRYLKVEQLYFQLYYKVLSKLRALFGKKENYTLYKKGTKISFLPFPEKSVTYRGDDTFVFLNLSHKFNGTWDDRSLGDLWRYNLNYMDFILQPAMDVAQGMRWICSFADNITRNSIAADPYPISLRGINWIKFVSVHWSGLTDEMRRDVDTSLYSQYRILYQRPERHLLANHYLENGFSLLFAAVYFRDKDFWNRARQITEQQLKEQIMSDGAHYELSPMYHCIILERLLDCCNLLSNVDDGLFPSLCEYRNMLRETASKMLAWLDAIAVGGNSIPLLNDSANGIALLPNQIREYAARLGLEWNCGALGESGYRHIVRSQYDAVLDMAQLGVSYNLGHAHADSSTFLLWVNGRELLVDTGTSTYNNCERRSYERSTRAHNAVVVDNTDSSKVWGAFRCAQRAQVTIEKDGPDVFQISHNGYVNKGILSRRTFVCDENRMVVKDVLTGCSKSIAYAYFHLSPEVEVQAVEENRVVTDRAVFEFDGHCSLHIVEEKIAKEYNVLQPTHCIQLAFTGTLHTVINGFK